MRDAEGCILRWFVLQTGIAERKRNEAALTSAFESIAKSEVVNPRRSRAKEDDLFARLTIEFNSFGCLGERDDWRFSLDSGIATMQLVVSNTALDPVPEPGSLVRLGSGLLGLRTACAGDG